MTIPDQIFGFRQDRIGARIICLLNVLRIQETFGVSGPYLWLSQPDGPYPELADPADFLAPETIRRHIRVVATHPDREGYRNLKSIAPGIGAAQFARLLAEGARFECDSMAEIVGFMDEPLHALSRQMRRIAQGVELGAQLQDALARARVRIAQVAGGPPEAIHVRRGDILDGDPWSYSCWPSKYVPDEFFRAFIDSTQGPVIAFSDTPAAVAHLCRGNPRVVAVAGLFDDPQLTVAQRDLLELVLMGECARVGAPSQSAFSQAASIIGGARIVALPAHLPPKDKLAANDALLDRIIGAQDSFFAPGDLAQSVTYAAPHALTVQRGPQLVDSLAGQAELLERFPFLYRELAVTALACGQRAKARRLARQGLKSPLIRNRDKPQCTQVLMMLDDQQSQGPADELDAKFLTTLFSGRAADGPIVPALAHRLLMQGGRACDALMFDPLLLPDYAIPATEVLAGDDRDGLVLPLWTLRSDWSELVTEKSLSHDLLTRVNLWRKTEPATALMADAEAALAAGTRPAIPDALGFARLGFAAAQLRLHGRLQRAFRLLHWLNDVRPGHAMTHKRLADACFTAGNHKAAERWLTSAMALAPGNALLLISAALRASDADDTELAQQRADMAQAAWPELELNARLAKRLRRTARKAKRA